MTYQTDPSRWTHSLGDAPELLRGGFEAAGREGPNDLQMRTLALKLAAVGTGAAVAAGAASAAKASGTAAGTGFVAASGGTSVLTKIAVSVALVGAVGTGGTLLLRQPAPSSATPSSATQNIVAHEAVAAPVVSAPVMPAQEPVLQNVAPVVPVAERVQVEQPSADLAQADSVEAPSAQAPSVDADKSARTERRERGKSERREHAATGPVAVNVAQPARTAPAVEQVSGQKPQLNEIDLLSKARAALAARPREAFRLTEEHKALYPQGMFGQERDALAVEALQRSGDLKHAREAAESFVKRYPSSPHAHRFRETMNLQ